MHNVVIPSDVDLAREFVLDRAEGALAKIIAVCTPDAADLAGS